MEGTTVLGTVGGSDPGLAGVGSMPKSSKTTRTPGHVASAVSLTSFWSCTHCTPYHLFSQQQVSHLHKCVTCCGDRIHQTSLPTSAPWPCNVSYYVHFAK